MHPFPNFNHNSQEEGYIRKAACLVVHTLGKSIMGLNLTVVIYAHHSSELILKYMLIYYHYFFKLSSTGIGEVAQWIKWLSWHHGNGSSDPKNQSKGRCDITHLQFQWAWDEMRVGLSAGADRTANLGLLGSEDQDTCFKQDGFEPWHQNFPWRLVACNMAGAHSHACTETVYTLSIPYWNVYVCVYVCM